MAKVDEKHLFDLTVRVKNITSSEATLIIRDTEFFQNISDVVPDKEYSVELEKSYVPLPEVTKTTQLPISEKK